MMPLTLGTITDCKTTWSKLQRSSQWTDPEWTIAAQLSQDELQRWFEPYGGWSTTAGYYSNLQEIWQALTLFYLNKDATIYNLCVGADNSRLKQLLCRLVPIGEEVIFDDAVYVRTRSGWGKARRLT